LQGEIGWITEPQSSRRTRNRFFELYGYIFLHYFQVIHGLLRI